MTSLTQETLDTVKRIDDERVIKFLERAVTDLLTQKMEINNYTKIILTMLASQLVIYYKALDKVMSDSSLSSQDDYKRVSKAPEISILQKAHDQILALLDKLSLSPIVKAKLKKLNSSDEATAEALLNDLIS